MFEISIEKVAWVTGGSRGIGRAVCLALAKAGCRVAVGYQKNLAAADEVVAQIGAMGGEALAIELDVTDGASCQEACETIVSQFGEINILIDFINDLSEECPGFHVIIGILKHRLDQIALFIFAGINVHPLKSPEKFIVYKIKKLIPGHSFIMCRPIPPP